MTITEERIKELLAAAKKDDKQEYVTLLEERLESMETKRKEEEKRKAQEAKDKEEEERKAKEEEERRAKLKQIDRHNEDLEAQKAETERVKQELEEIKRERAEEKMAAKERKKSAVMAKIKELPEADQKLVKDLGGEDPESLEAAYTRLKAANKIGQPPTPTYRVGGRGYRRPQSPKEGEKPKSWEEEQDDWLYGQREPINA
jgi:hypothetical protein